MPYLKIAAVVALGTGILAVGVLGPHPAPRPTPSTDASLIARIPSPTAPTVAPFPAPSTSPTVPIANRSDSLVGLTRVVPLADQIKVSWLPGQITSGSMAVVGMRIFYVVDANRIQSTEVGSDQAGQSLVSVPSCEGINQLAAAGHELAYVVTSPGGPTATVHDCGGAGRVSWSVWLLDLNGGGPRRVAQGVRAASSIEIDEFPIHLALTDSAYAFNRPPVSAAAGLGETVEVHAIDGQLLWTSRTKRPVASVMLGGGTLAILTDVLSQADGVVNLYTSSAARPDPAPMDQPAASASLSPDGLHLAWDVAYQGPFPGPNPGVDVAIGTVASGVDDALVRPAVPADAVVFLGPDRARRSAERRQPAYLPGHHRRRHPAPRLRRRGPAGSPARRAGARRTWSCRCGSGGSRRASARASSSTCARRSSPTSSEMPIAFFTRTQTGALVSRLNNDVLDAQQAFTDTFSSVVGNVIGVAITLAAMLLLSWQITLVALVLLPMFLLPARWVGRRIQAITRESYNLNAKMISMMTERFNVAGALLVKLFGRPCARSAASRRRPAGCATSASRRPCTRGCSWRDPAHRVAGHRARLRLGRRAGRRRRAQVGTVVA
jgi:hypothetical protein